MDQEITGRDPTTTQTELDEWSRVHHDPGRECPAGCPFCADDRADNTSEGEDPSSQVEDAAMRGVDSLNVRLAVADNLDKLADRASEMADLVREHEEEGGGNFRVLETAGKTCKAMSETLHTIHGIFIVEAQRERGMDIEDFSSQVDRDR